jgi:PAS domain S-box-containing protein
MLVDLARFRRKNPGNFLFRYGVAVAVVLLAAGLRWSLELLLGAGSYAFITFFPAALVAAVVGGAGSGILAIVLGGVAAWLLMLAGNQPLRGPDIGATAVYAAGGLLIVVVAARLRDAWERIDRAQQRLVAALDASGTGTWRWDIQNDVVEWDEALSRVYGIAHQQAPRTSGEFFAFVHPDDRQRASQVIERSLRLGVEADYEFRVRLADGTERWIYDRSKVIRDESGRPRSMVGACLDVTKRKEAEKAIAESEARLRRAHAAGQIGDWDMDLATGKVTWSDNLYALLGLEAKAFAHTHSQMELVHPDDRERLQRAVEETVGGQRRLDTEFRVRHGNGDYRWLATRGELQMDAHGRPVRLVGVNFDVTDRRRAQERQELLINELNHRVKNTLATVQSLALMTVKSTGSSAHFGEAFLGRLMALSSTHNLLTETSWENAWLHDVVASELQPFTDPEGKRIALSGESISLKPREAVCLGLVFHELATNASKYGALASPTGRIALSWHIEASGALALTWREEGGPPVSAPVRRGFGSRLIEASVKEELGGQVTLTYAPAGLQAVLTFPLRSGPRRPVKLAARTR